MPTDDRDGDKTGPHWFSHHPDAAGTPGVCGVQWSVSVSEAPWAKRIIHAGVEIYEFQPTMLHCKVMVWTSCGRP